MTRQDDLTYADRAEAVLVEAGSRQRTIPIWLIRQGHEEEDLGQLDGAQRAWLDATGWTAKPGRHALLPGDDGKLAAVAFGMPESENGAGADPFAGLAVGGLPSVLPEGAYHLANAPENEALACLAWLLGAYRFDRYKPGEGNGPVRLKPGKGVDRQVLVAAARAVYLGRDLINTPANDLGPEELEDAARSLAGGHGAEIAVTVGDDLIAENFPMIHAVGRASTRAPRLIDLRWSPSRGGRRSGGGGGRPRVTLVGKGICFDTGGLSIKPSSAMLLMKKDMGGAAAVLTLAALIMHAGLAVELRVLIPAAENSISGNAFRPSDVLTARNGTTVEIANTDAEGRLVLADALALAAEETPDYLFSFATLTGAARVALGPDLPPFYSTDEELASVVLAAAGEVADPLWRMPFWAPYDKLIAGKVADVNHIYDSPFAGSITAALFLKRFVSGARRYAHLDIYGWVPRTRAGVPEGGEPQGARAVFAALQEIVHS